MTEFEVELPSKESAGCFAQIIELDVTKSVLITVAQEASKNYDGFYAQWSIP